MTDSDFERIFATSPDGIPWNVQEETVTTDGGVSYENWIGLWQKLFSENPKIGFKNLVYIGFCGKMNEAVDLQRLKQTDILKKIKRTVINVYVIGSY